MILIVPSKIKKHIYLQMTYVQKTEILKKLITPFAISTNSGKVFQQYHVASKDHARDNRLLCYKLNCLLNETIAFISRM